MHLLDQRNAEIFILLLWAMLVVAKGMATGSLLKDRPQGGVRMWLTHVYNFDNFPAVVNRAQASRMHPAP